MTPLTSPAPTPPSLPANFTFLCRAVIAHLESLVSRADEQVRMATFHFVTSPEQAKYIVLRRIADSDRRKSPVEQGATGWSSITRLDEIERVDALEMTKVGSAPKIDMPQPSATDPYAGDPFRLSPAATSTQTAAAASVTKAGDIGIVGWALLLVAALVGAKCAWAAGFGEPVLVEGGAHVTGGVCGLEVAEMAKESQLCPYFAGFDDAKEGLADGVCLLGEEEVIEELQSHTLDDTGATATFLAYPGYAHPTSFDDVEPDVPIFSTGDHSFFGATVLTSFLITSASMCSPILAQQIAVVFNLFFSVLAISTYYDEDILSFAEYEEHHINFIIPPVFYGLAMLVFFAMNISDTRSPGLRAWRRVVGSKGRKGKEGTRARSAVAALLVLSWAGFAGAFGVGGAEEAGGRGVGVAGGGRMLAEHAVGAQPDLYNKISKDGTALMANGDTVIVASGNYEAGSADSATRMFRPYELYGSIRCEADDLSCVLNGSGTRQVVYIFGTSGSLLESARKKEWLEIRSIVISNGYTEYNGGGLWIAFYAQVTLVMCSIQQNVGTGKGGGIFVHSSDNVVDLYGVTFSGNTSPDGPDINRDPPQYSTNSDGGTVTIHTTCPAGSSSDITATQGSALSTSGTIAGPLFSFTASCDVCPDNTYRSYGESSCSACSVPGAVILSTSRFDHDSVEDCVSSCAAGSYQSSVDSDQKSVCTLCAAGTKSSIAGSFVDTCTLCTGGGYSTDGAAECTPCADGSSTPGEASTSASDCEVCPASGCIFHVSAQPDLYNKISYGGTAQMANGDTVIVASGNYAAGSAYISNRMFQLNGLYGSIRCEADDLSCVLNGSGTRTVMYVDNTVVYINNPTWETSSGVLELRSIVVSNGHGGGRGGLVIQNDVQVSVVMCSFQQIESTESDSGAIFVDGQYTVVDFYGSSFSGNTATDIRRLGGSVTVHSTCSAGGDVAIQGSALSTLGTVGGSKFSYSCGFHWASKQPDLFDKIQYNVVYKMANGDTVTVASGNYAAGSAHDDYTMFFLSELSGSINCETDSLSCELDGSGTRRVIEVDGTGGSLLGFRGLVVTNGKTGAGGGFYIHSSAQVTLVMCGIKKNEADREGGGIYASQVGTTVNLFGVSFMGNAAVTGPDIYESSSGGTVAVHATCTAGGDAAVQQAALSTSGTVGGDLHSYICSCSAGTYGPSVYACTPCAAGGYSGVGALSCTSCGAGKYLETSAVSSESSACTICGAGGYSGVSAVSCTPCAAGKFLDDAGTDATLHDAESDCVDCGAGTSAASSESSACTICGAGGYSGVSAVSCTPCAPGKFLDDSGTDATLHDAESDCVDCGASQTSVAGSASCVTTWEVSTFMELSEKLPPYGVGAMPAGDVLNVAIGTYAGSGASFQGLFVVMGLFGSINCAQDSGCVLDGQNSMRVMMIQSNSDVLELRGLTIANGRDIQGYGMAGGGLYIEYAAVTLVMCSIRGSHGEGYFAGGGIYMQGGDVNLYGVSFGGNTANDAEPSDEVPGAPDIFLADGALTIHSTCSEGGDAAVQLSALETVDAIFGQPYTITGDRFSYTCTRKTFEVSTQAELANTIAGTGSLMASGGADVVTVVSGSYIYEMPVEPWDGYSPFGTILCGKSGRIECANADLSCVLEGASSASVLQIDGTGGGVLELRGLVIANGMGHKNGMGGGLYIQSMGSYGGAQVTLVSCSIDYNMANNLGGGIMFIPSESGDDVVNLYGVSFSGNWAMEGSDIYATGGTVTVHSTCPEGGVAVAQYPLVIGGPVGGELNSYTCPNACTATTNPNGDGLDGNFYCGSGGVIGGTVGDCECTCGSGYSGLGCATADACVATTENSDDGLDGNFYCGSGGVIGGITGDCECMCDAGYSGPGCAADGCVATTDPSDDGSDGNFYCGSGGVIGGTTGDCECMCDAGYSGPGCAADVCVATTNPSDDGLDGNYYCGSGGAIGGTPGNCECTCGAGYSGLGCATTNACVATAESSDDGADGNLHCVNGGTVGGTTGSCECTGCDAGYSGLGCATADACTATTDPSDDGVDGNFYCGSVGSIGGTTGDCECTCNAGHGGFGCATANACVSTAQPSDDGADGNLYCGSGGAVGGTTGGCECTCDAGYGGPGCASVAYGVSTQPDLYDKISSGGTAKISSGETVVLAPGTYAAGSAHSVNRLFFLYSLFGYVFCEEDGLRCVLDGSSTRRIMYAGVPGGTNPALLEMRGLVFTNGATEAGAGLFVDGGAIVTLVACSFVENAASLNGGALYSYSSSDVITLYGVSFSGNTGAVNDIYSLSGGAITVHSTCTEGGNNATQGVGLVTTAGCCTGSLLSYSCGVWVDTQPDLFNKISTTGTSKHDGDTVTLASGSYEAGSYDSSDKTFYLKDLAGKLVCQADDLSCLLDGSNARRIMYIYACEFEFRSLVFANGRSWEYGGAVRTQSEVLITFVMCRFQNNYAGYAGSVGGGVYIGSTGGVNLYECSFSGNTAPIAADIYGGTVTGSVVIVYSVCYDSGNEAVQGGALSVAGDIGGSAYLYSCGFHLIGTQLYMHNAISNSGANNMNKGDTVSLIAGTYVAGSAHDADTVFWLEGLFGNIRCELDNLVCAVDGSETRRVLRVTDTSGGVLELRSITFSNGRTSGNSGGMAIVDDALVTLVMCSFVDNTAVLSGGGVYVYSSGSEVDLYGVSFLGNSAPDGPDLFRNAGTVTVHSTCSEGGDDGFQGLPLSTTGTIGGSLHSFCECTDGYEGTGCRPCTANANGDPCENGGAVAGTTGSCSCDCSNTTFHGDACENKVCGRGSGVYPPGPTPGLLLPTFELIRLEGGRATFDDSGTIVHGRLDVNKDPPGYFQGWYVYPTTKPNSANLETVACRQIGSDLRWTLISAAKIPGTFYPVVAESELTGWPHEDFLWNVGVVGGYGGNCDGSEETVQSCPTFAASNSARLQERNDRYYWAGQSGGVICEYAPQGSECEVCPAGRYSNTTGSESCVACAHGTYNPYPGSTLPSSCQLCPAGYMSSTAAANSSLTCVGCSAGTYSARGSASCATCDAGSSSTPNSAECSFCPGGTASSSGLLCQDCAVGRYSLEGAPLCSECASGTSNNATGSNSSEACLTCLSGTRSSSGASVCVDCSPGTIANAAEGATSCTDCEAGSSSPSNATSCHLCQAGSVSLIGGLCTTCGTGKYADDLTGAIACIDCAAGRYSQVAGSVNSTDCLLCPAGTSSPQPAATNIDDCLECTFSGTSAEDKSSCWHQVSTQSLLFDTVSSSGSALMAVGDTAVVARGTYAAGLTETWTRMLAFNDFHGTIRCVLDDYSCELDGSSTYRLITVGGTGVGVLELRSLAVANGIAGPNEGGLGGGMLVASGEVSVLLCIFRGNRALRRYHNNNGGGIYVSAGATATITVCSFLDNTVGDVSGSATFSAACPDGYSSVQSGPGYSYTCEYDPPSPSHSFDFRGCSASSGVTDSIANSLVATLMNGASCSASGLELDGVDDYAVITPWAMGGTVSLEALIRYDSFKTDSRVVDFDDILLGNLGDSSRIEGSGLLAGNWDASLWTHVVTTVSGSTARVYKDGVLTNSTLNATPLPYSTRDRHWLGSAFDGTIAFVKTWQDVELNEKDVAALFAPHHNAPCQPGYGVTVTSSPPTWGFKVASSDLRLACSVGQQADPGPTEGLVPATSSAIRLEAGTASFDAEFTIEGSLEVFVEGAWVTFYGYHSGFRGDDVNEATVACRQLGDELGYTLTSARKVVGYGSTSAVISASSGAIYEVTCGGSELTLENCTYFAASASTAHAHDQKVSCTFEALGDTCETGVVSFVESWTVSGGLELLTDGVWGTIQAGDYGFNSTEASVACNELGLALGYLVLDATPFHPREISVNSTHNATHAITACAGSEASLQDCSKTDVADANHALDIGVSCTFQPYTTECLPCPRGTFRTGRDIAACSACAEGEFQEFPGATSCETCGAGSYSDASTGTVLCTDCTRGHYSSTGASSCEFCPPGKSAPNEGTTACSVCASGASTEDRVFCPCLPGSGQTTNLLPGTQAANDRIRLMSTTDNKTMSTVDYDGISFGRVEFLFEPFVTTTNQWLPTGWPEWLGPDLENVNYLSVSCQDSSGCEIQGAWVVAYERLSTSTALPSLVCDELGAAFGVPALSAVLVASEDAPQKSSVVWHIHIDDACDSSENPTLGVDPVFTSGTDCLGNAGLGMIRPTFYAVQGRAFGVMCKFPAPTGECVTCPNGKYQSDIAVAGCLACSPGRHHNKTGSSTFADCELCEAGKASSVEVSSSSLDCELCPAGTFAPAGSSACISCGAGFWNPSNGSASALDCTACPYYTASAIDVAISQDTCQSCPADTFPNRLVGASVCQTLTEAYAAVETGEVLTLTPEYTFAPTCGDWMNLYGGKIGDGTNLRMSGGKDIICSNINEKCTFDGNGANRLVWISYGNQEVTGVLFYRSKGAGGTVPWSSGHTTSSAYSGGAIFMSGGTMTATACDFISSIYTAVYVYGGGPITFRGSYFASNTGDIAGSYTSEPAPAGYSSVADETKAYSYTTAYCVPGTFASESGQAGCAICGAGNFASSYGSTACTLCPNGKIIATNGTNGTFHDSEDDCQSCSAVQYSSDDRTACLWAATCVKGSGLTPDKSACQICQVGRFSLEDAVTDCVDCGVGLTTAAINSTSPEDCIQCSTGKYNELGEGGECLSCAVGTANSEEGGENAAACLNCEAGKYANSEASAACTDCSAGKYSVTLGAYSSAFCTNCDAGSSSGPGSFSCAACMAGFYNPTAGDTCQPCVEGTANANAGSVDVADCVSCLRGSYSLLNSTECVDCQAGRYNPAADQGACFDCARGKYLEETGAVFDAECQPCGVGTASDVDGRGTPCDDCGAGSIAPSTGYILCAPCVSGTFAAFDGSSSCEQCAIGRYSQVLEATSCLVCGEGKFSDSAASVICSACPGGTRSRANRAGCMACEVGKFSLPGAANCTACAHEEGFVAAGTGSSACAYCGPGLYASTESNSCLPCSASSYSVGGSDSCSACSDNTFSANDGLSVCSFCPSGSIVGGDSTGCVDCESGKASSIGDTVCADCPAGLFASTGASVCDFCQPGTWSPVVSESCDGCVAGKVSSVGAAECSDCVAGKYESNNNCLACPAGTVSGPGAAVCDSDCPVGTYGVVGAVECNECAAGKFAGLGAASCELCSAGSFSEVRAETCTTCEDGTHSSSGAATCSDCLAGKSSSDGASACEQCSAGMFSSAAASSCTPCESGTYSFSGAATCSDCLAGKSSSDDASTCEQCSAGTFSGAGASTCSSCESGGYSGSGAATCSDCLAGKSSSDGASACEQCSAGTFSSAASSSCTSCESGAYSVSGAATCSDCLAGKLSSDGASTCEQCSAGTFSDAAAPSCTPCESGAYSVSGAATCSDCLAGKSSSDDASTCEQCSAGTFSGAGASTCSSCESGEYSGSGAATCSDCLAGKSSSDGALACEECSAGTFSSAAASSCTPCENGTFSVSGAATCSDCIAGKSSSDGASACEQCSAGTFSDAAAPSCTLCAPGARSAGGASRCELCSAGKFSSDLRIECINCESGKFSAAGASACATACSAGTFAGVGAESCLNCLPGTFSAIGAEFCAICASGKFSGSAAPACLSCDAGKFSSGGSSACVSCDQGEYQSLTSASSCLTCSTCAVGTHVSSHCSPTADTGCTQCAPGSASTGGSSDCKECDVGSTFQPLQGMPFCSSCTVCGLGKSIAQSCTTTTDATCDKCAAGKASVGGESACAPCDQQGEYSAAGDAFCSTAGSGYSVTKPYRNGSTPCASGFYSPGAVDNCQPCSVGGEFSAAPSSPSCSRAAPGHQPNLIRTAQLPCPAGTYSATGDACLPCEYGARSDPAASACEFCTSGLYHEDNECIPCPKGTYSSAGAKSLPLCVQCDEGYVSQEPGAYFCEACSAGKYTLSSHSCVDCAAGKYSALAVVECIQCDLGKYVDFEGGESCQFCDNKDALIGSSTLETGSSTANDCVCDIGEYNPLLSKLSTCTVCMDGVNCTERGSRVDEFWIEAGYWRSGNASKKIEPCAVDDACVGGQGNDTCADGHGGVLCGVCDDGWVLGSDGMCSVCGDDKVLNVVVGFSALLFAIVFALCLFKNRGHIKKELKCEERAHSASTFKAKLKILASTFQIISQFGSILSIKFPKLFEKFLALLSGLVNVKFLQLIPLGCFVDTSFHSALVVETVIPLLLSIVLYIVFKIRSRIAATFNDVEKLRQEFYSLFLALTFMIFSSVSTRIFMTFRCDTYGDDPTRYLVADLKIDCDSDEHKQYQSYALVMMLVYPFGITGLYTALLVLNRHALKRGEEVGHLDFLTSMYRREAWWFEIFECVRRLSMTGFLVFIEPGTSAQIVTALVMCIAGIEMYSTVEPFAASEDHALSKVSSWAIFTTLFGALLVKLQAVERRGAGDVVMAVTLVLMNVLGVAAVIVNVLMEVGGNMLYAARFFHRHSGALREVSDEDFVKYCKDVAKSSRELAGWEVIKERKELKGVSEERCASGKGYIDQFRFSIDCEKVRWKEVVGLIARVSGSAAGSYKGHKVQLNHLVVKGEREVGSKILLRESCMNLGFLPTRVRDFVVEQEEVREEGFRMVCCKSHASAEDEIAIGDRRAFVRGVVKLEAFVLEKVGGGVIRFTWVYGADYNSNYVPSDVLFRRICRLKVGDLRKNLDRIDRGEEDAVVAASARGGRGGKVVPIMAGKDEGNGVREAETVENEIRVRVKKEEKEREETAKGEGETRNSEKERELEVLRAEIKALREEKKVPDAVAELCALFDKDGEGEVNEAEVRDARNLIESVQAVKTEVETVEENDGDSSAMIDELKKQEMLARLSAEEEKEAEMKKQHELMTKKLEERKKKRRKMRQRLGEKVEVVKEVQIEEAVLEKAVEAPPIPDYLMDLVKLFDKNGDGEVNEAEVNEARKLIESVQALKTEVETVVENDGDSSAMLDELKKQEMLARLSAEEEKEAEMKKQHELMTKKLEERKKKRRKMRQRLGEQVEAVEEVQVEAAVEEKIVEVPVIPDYLTELVALFDKDGDGSVNQSEVEAAMQFVSSEGLQQLVKLFDADGDGNINQSEVQAAQKFVSSDGLQALVKLFDEDGDGKIDLAEISAAKKLVMSMKTAKQEMSVSESWDKLDSIKRDEKLARLKAEEKKEDAMKRQHDGIQAKLEERKLKRRAAIDKMERAGKEEELAKKSEGKVNLETIGLKKSGRVARETHKNIDLGDLLGDDDDDWG